MDKIKKDKNPIRSAYIYYDAPADSPIALAFIEGCKKLGFKNIYYRDSSPEAN